MFEEKLIMNLRISQKIPITIFDHEKIHTVVMDLKDNNLITLRDNKIVIKKKGQKMLDYIARSLVDCY